MWVVLTRNEKQQVLKDVVGHWDICPPGVGDGRGRGLYRSVFRTPEYPDNKPYTVWSGITENICPLTLHTPSPAARACTDVIGQLV